MVYITAETASKAPIKVTTMRVWTNLDNAIVFLELERIGKIENYMKNFDDEPLRWCSIDSHYGTYPSINIYEVNADEDKIAKKMKQVPALIRSRIRELLPTIMRKAAEKGWRRNIYAGETIT